MMLTADWGWLVWLCFWLVWLCCWVGCGVFLFVLLVLCGFVSIMVVVLFSVCFMSCAVGCVSFVSFVQVVCAVCG